MSGSIKAYLLLRKKGCKRSSIRNTLHSLHINIVISSSCSVCSTHAYINMYDSRNYNRNSCRSQSYLHSFINTFCSNRITTKHTQQHNNNNKGNKGNIILIFIYRLSYHNLSSLISKTFGKLR